jgi:multiple sugar transport system ATP-binding protein
MAQLDFDAVTKTYSGRVAALDRFSLSVADRELVVLVGPSGAGKTTVLRIAAGLEQATSGSMRMNGEPIDHLPPAQRDMAMVFQQPALYPHLTVRQNAAFSLSLRHVSPAEIDRRIAQTAEGLRISSLLDRYPDTLSGGEAQRAALARAFVRRPGIRLLDEPLSSLDAPLRAELRHDLHTAHRRDPITTLYVTHDQEEALSLADRLVVLRAGTIQQIGTPEEIYRQPANRFVAAFLGRPPMSFIEGTVVDRGEELGFEFGGNRLPIAAELRAKMRPYAGQALTLGVRAQQLSLTPQSPPGARSAALSVQIQDREYQGDRWLIRGTTDSGELVAALVENPVDAVMGETACFYVDPGCAYYFEPGDCGANLAMG